MIVVQTFARGEMIRAPPQQAGTSGRLTARDDGELVEGVGDVALDGEGAQIQGAQ
jgi:hypothetical protein